MGVLAKWARNRLLRRCEARHAALLGRDDGYDGSTEEIRSGIRAAEKVIRRVEPEGSLRAYLEAVDAELLREQGRVMSPREDDRTTAGLATIRMDLSRVRGGLTRDFTLALLCAGGLAVVLGVMLTRR